MNPMFIILVLLGAILVWFLFSFAYKPIGNVLHRLWKDAIDEINKEEKTEEKEI